MKLETKYLWLLLLGACSTQMPSPDTATKTWRADAGLDAQKQESEQWCVYTVASIMTGGKTKPCEFATAKHNTNCCVSNGSGKCLQSDLLENVLSRAKIHHYLSYEPSYAKVVELIKSKQPVAIMHKFARADAGVGTTHQVIAHTVFESSDKEYLLIFDPLTGTNKTWDSSYVEGNMAWVSLIWLK